MTERILPFLIHFVTQVIGSLGYAGIAALMGIESACIPLPRNHHALCRLPGVHRALQPVLGRNSRCDWLQPRVRDRLLGWRCGRASAGGALRPLGAHEPSRPRSDDALLREIRHHHRPARTIVAGCQNIHRFSGGCSQNAATAVSHLHVYRLVAVVLRPCLCGHEAREKWHTDPRSSRPFIAFTWWSNWVSSSRSSGSYGHTSTASAKPARPDGTPKAGLREYTVASPQDIWICKYIRKAIKGRLGRLR